MTLSPSGLLPATASSDGLLRVYEVSFGRAEVKGLVYAGFTSIEVWVGLLRALLGDRLELVDVPATRERFGRDGRVIELDHETLTVGSIGPD